MLATITVLVLPPRLSCSSRVSLESRYGMWPVRVWNRMHVRLHCQAFGCGVRLMAAQGVPRPGQGSASTCSHALTALAIHEC
jgi:hypothetical protein